MDRRSMISTLPAGMMAGMIAGRAVKAASSSQVDGLFDAWKQARQDWLDQPEESPEAAAFWDQMTVLERRMIEAPANSASDLAKTLFAWFSEEMGDDAINQKIAYLAGMA